MSPHLGVRGSYEQEPSKGSRKGKTRGPLLGLCPLALVVLPPCNLGLCPGCHSRCSPGFPGACEGPHCCHGGLQLWPSSSLSPPRSAASPSLSQPEAEAGDLGPEEQQEDWGGVGSDLQGSHNSPSWHPKEWGLWPTPITRSQ